jgi:hypothetical protein
MYDLGIRPSEHDHRSLWPTTEDAASCSQARPST